MSNPDISFGLKDRVCIVTGGAQGIGEACIRRFARENAGFYRNRKGIQQGIQFR